jgi:hypothetical protein
MGRMLSKLITAAVTIIVLLAIWRANNGDMTSIVNATWTILSAGADIAISIWHQVVNVSGHAAAIPSPAASA